VSDKNSTLFQEVGTLNIALDTNYPNWQVTVTYDQNVTGLQAWPGLVTTVNPQTFNINPDCPDTRLYSWQVLSLGFVLAHNSLTAPNILVYLNGKPVPPCNSSASTTTASSCPYQSDPQYVLACQLYQYLVGMQGSSSSSSGAACPYATDPAHVLACQLYDRLMQLQLASSIGAGALQALLSTNVFKGSLLGSGNNVSCAYSNNPTSSNLLCSLYCQIQQFYNLTCGSGPTTLTTPPSCPYSSDPEGVLACSLYNRLLDLQFSSSSGSSNFASVLGLNTYKGSGNSSGGSVTCLYSTNPTSANLLCYLYCMIQPYYSQQCMNAPTSLLWTPTTTPSQSSCPYISDPESALACSLYNRLLQLQAASSLPSTLNSILDLGVFKGSGSSSGGFVNCTYASNPTSANLLCYLYCLIQPFYGQQCQNGPTSLSWNPTTLPPTASSCPYISDPENVLACQLYNRLIQLQSASSASSSTLNYVINLDIFKGSGTGSGGFVNCTYASNPTSANLLCYLYCLIQPFYGQTCLNRPTSLAWQSNTGTSTISMNSIQCIYAYNVSSALLCSMYCQIQSYLGFICQNYTITSAISSGTTVSTCPYISDPQSSLACQMYSYLTQLQDSASGGSSMSSVLSQLLTGAFFKGSGSGSGIYVNCSYRNDPTSANLLCYLYCMIQPYFGLQCLNAPTSLVWTPTTSASKAATTSLTCPYIADPQSTLACQMYNYLTQLQGASSGGSSLSSSISQLIAAALFKGSGSGSGGYVNCSYSNYPTSANLLCYLYCMIQPYFGLQCLNAPTSLVWLPTTSATNLTSTSPACPYLSDPQSTLACQMYNYLKQLQVASSGGSSTM